MENETHKSGGRRTNLGLQHRRHGIEKFARSHYKWIIAIGSLIISLTLTARERLQERLRDFTNSVETAETFERLKIENRRQTETLSLQLNYIAEELKTGRPRSSIHDADGMVVQFKKVENDLTSVLNNLEGDKVLAELVPDDENLRTALKESFSRTQTLFGRVIGHIYENEGSVMADLYRSGIPRDLDTQVIALEQDENRLREEILYLIERKKELYGRRFAYISWLSYFLIALGTAVSFLGHRAGRDGELPDFKL